MRLDMFEGARGARGARGSESFGKLEQTYEKESVGEKSVSKNSPSRPSASSLASIQDLRHHERDNHADKFIAGIGDQVEKLRVVAYAQNISSKLEPQDLQGYHSESGCGGQAHDFRVKSST